MKELTSFYKQRGEEFINNLLTKYILVTEKLSGSSFSFQVTSGSLNFYKGNIKRPINLVDRTLMIYYEKPINYINKVISPIINEIPENWEFCFQYFVHNEPGIIEYDNLPKNHLVLTHILIRGSNNKIAKIIDDPRIIEDWSNKINVTPLKPIFKGYLNKQQKKKIKDFISLSIEDQEELFNTKSFASYLINLLDSNIENTTLHDDLNKPIDSIIFKFYKPGTSEVFSAKLIDPYTKSLMKEKEEVDIRRVPADTNEILLLDILAFLEERGLKKHEILTNTAEERYIELISCIFNDYVKHHKDLDEMNFDTANFIKGDEFSLNTNFIYNKKTQELVNQSDNLNKLFKIILGSLRKPRDPNKCGNILTPTIIEDFNKMIKKIKNIVSDNIKSEDTNFKTFNDYIKIKKSNENLFEQTGLDELIEEERNMSINSFIKIKNK